MKLINLLLILFITASCSGISMLAVQDQSDLYTADFMREIAVIKKYYAQGNHSQAMENLSRFKEEEMLPTEVALKNNLEGVILFSQKEFYDAQVRFERALLTSRLDGSLTSQIYLNLASVQYKTGNFQVAYDTLEKADYKKLKDEEAKKFHKLRYRLSEQLGKSKHALVALVFSLSGLKSMNELKNDANFTYLIELFNEMESREKIRFFEEMDENNFFVLAYLAYLEGEKLYYEGKKEDGKDLLKWVTNHYENFPEITSLANSFLNRLDNFSKLDSMKIGVVLPLSGDKKNFGKRALLGIDLAIQEVNKGRDQKFQLLIKDSEASGVAGAYRVKELVEKHSVGAIIGGLFSKEAEKEFEEAKKSGVPFISLSQVFLAKEKKNHLLLEMPGSVESLISRLFSPEMIKLFGSRAAIIYPETNRGQAYLDEFWRKAKVNNVNVTGIMPYGQGKTDYRAPIKNLLGLGYPRQRKEEFELLEEIYSLEKRSSIRRIQTLKPIVDFDWVFIPSYPKETVQILPSFSYYDAFKLNIIGGPSWRSGSVVNGSSTKHGAIYFVGDKVGNQTEEEFVKSFGTKYKMRAGLIELRSYDALKIITKLLSETEYKSRDELDMAIRTRDKLQGESGTWRMEEGVWTKEMEPLRIKRKKVESIFQPENV